MIVIVGGGIVGLTLAAALAKSSVPITLVETKLPSLQEKKENDLDSRVSAINLTSQRILANLGIWSQLSAASVSPLRKLRVWDHLGGGEITFDSAEIGTAELGFIVENRVLIKILWQHLQNFTHVRLLCPKQPEQIIYEPQQLKLQFTDQSDISADLIIGADGSDSWLRKQMAIPVYKRSYQQQAIIAVAGCEKPHQETGWQSFLPDGPLGVLPLANSHQVAIVWSTSLQHAEELMHLPLLDFNFQLTQALKQRLGKMELLTDLKVLPLVMSHAREYVKPRLALIGDAAHTIHPLAGQGINLGLMDAACLAQVLLEAGEKGSDIGSLRTLRRYQRWRKGYNCTMQMAMLGFKELFAAGPTWLVQCRSQGLNIMDQMQLLKNKIMYYAVGEQGDLPNLASSAN